MTRTRVVVELVDFKIKQDQHDHEQQLINLLKKGLDTKFMRFSLDCLKVGTLDAVAGTCYDVLLSDEYDVVIVGEGINLNVYNRSSSVKTFDSKLLFQVSYYDRFRCLILIKEIGGEHIYATTHTDTVIKIRVSNLMMKNNELVWKSKKFSNVWGMDVLKGEIYIAQYLPPEIVVLDCESGQSVSEKFVPSISHGYGIHFFSEKEMLTSHSSYLELFEQQHDRKWESIRKSLFLMGTAYSIFFEELSNLIYISDPSKKQVVIVGKDDFSIVKKIGGFESNFGIKVDKRSGFLYVCDTVTHTVIVYK